MSIPDPIAMALCGGGLQRIELSEATLEAMLESASELITLTADEAAAFEEAAVSLMPVIVDIMVGKVIFNCIGGCFSQILIWPGENMQMAIVSFFKEGDTWLCDRLIT